MRRFVALPPFVLLLVVLLVGSAAAQTATPAMILAGKVLRIKQASYTFSDDFPLDPQRACCTDQIAVIGLE